MAIHDAPNGLDALCAPLRLILDAEITAGNRITHLEGGCTDDSAVLVPLADAFRRELKPIDPDVVYREVNIRGMWKAQYMHVPTRHVLACGFGDS